MPHASQHVAHLMLKSSRITAHQSAAQHSTACTSPQGQAPVHCIAISGTQAMFSAREAQAPTLKRTTTWCDFMPAAANKCRKRSNNKAQHLLLDCTCNQPLAMLLCSQSVLVPACGVSAVLKLLPSTERPQNKAALLLHTTTQLLQNQMRVLGASLAANILGYVQRLPASHLPLLPGVIDVSAMLPA